MWLLKTETFQAMKSAKVAGFEPTEAERETFAQAVREAYAPKQGERPRNMKVEGSRAEISVSGVLTESPDCFAQLFGGGNTTYASIREGVRQAEENPDVKEIVLLVASPGGNVSGLFETLDVLAAARKPIRVRATLAASAAYALAAVAGPIEAVGRASEFDSVGVVARMYVEPDAIDITSTEAPNKRPDVQTDEGKAVVREELDEIHALFVDYIAKGRARTTGEETSAEKVNADFGRGSVFLASKAKSRGMIDSVPRAVAWSPRDKNATADSGGADEVTQERSMNKDELKQKHPETFAAVLEEGRLAGKAAELSRVKAHIKLAKAYGATDVAFAAIESDKSVQDDEVFADYQAAGVKRREQTAREEDDKEAGKSANGAASGKADSAAKDNPAQVVADIVTGKRNAEVA